jgi:hypothetical protein
MALKFMDFIREIILHIPRRKKLTLLQSNTTQACFDSNCALTCVLHVSACTEAILRYVNTKTYTFIS